MNTVGGGVTSPPPPPFMRMFTSTCSYFKKEMLEELLQNCVTDHYAIIEYQSVHTALSDNLPDCQNMGMNAVVLRTNAEVLVMCPTDHRSDCFKLSTLNSLQNLELRRRMMNT